MRELPAELTLFVGRQRELGALREVLAVARLVTVTGPGGVGKTRLALRAAAQAGTTVCLAELSGLNDEALLASTIAGHLGLPESGHGKSLDSIIDYLRDRELLLILDTCEHLIDACAEFADALLRGTAGVTVLATSRQPLTVPGEHIFSVPPLDLIDAVELFAQRAATVIGGFTVTDANRASVFALCERLDGVPLALELATVRLRALSMDQLTERLEDRFRLLTGGRRATLPHHQTLLAAIEWSYDLCTPDEQELWSRLSVFTGTFDVTSAEDVCGDGELLRDDVLATLIGLVDKSVVLRAGSRYWLLDTIREFGATRLSGQAPARVRYVSRYVTLAEQFAAHFTDDQLNRFRLLRAEHHNIRGAIETALGLGTDLAAARLVTTLDRYWQIAGLPREGQHWVTRLLDRFPGPSAERARLLVTRCFLAIGAETDGRQGIEIAETLGLHDVAARGYLSLNLSLGASGRIADAFAAGDQAERRLTELGDLAGLHALDAQLSVLHAVAAQPEPALARCEQGLRRTASLTEIWSTSYLYYARSLALFQQGKHNQASNAVGTALNMKAELGDLMGIAHCLEVLAWISSAEERPGRAAWLLGAAGALWQRTGRRVSGNPFLEGCHQQAAHAAERAAGRDRYRMLWQRGEQAALDQVVLLAGADADEPPAIAPSGPPDPCPGLTRRESEIARLAADGLSSRDIAARLVISKRTVDAHVEHIYAKLGISSRVQLATWLRSA